jgi:hypothetical protein
MIHTVVISNSSKGQIEHCAEGSVRGASCMKFMPTANSLLFSECYAEPPAHINFLPMTQLLEEAIQDLLELPAEDQDATALMIFAYLSTDRSDSVQDH